MAGLWIDLGPALTRLDALASQPDGLLEDVGTLPVLQYDLHRASELVAGLAPPSGAEAVHEELADALAEARDTTADIAESLEHGGFEAAAPLLWEWRGALFRIRFARLRLERPRPLPVLASEPQAAAPARRPPLLAAGAVTVGSALVLLAALLGLWLLVALTLTGTAAASLLLRP
jgi:hypothetical protein